MEYFWCNSRKLYWEERGGSKWNQRISVLLAVRRFTTIEVGMRSHRGRVPHLESLCRVVLQGRLQRQCGLTTGRGYGDMRSGGSGRI